MIPVDLDCPEAPAGVSSRTADALDGQTGRRHIMDHSPEAELSSDRSGA